MCRWRRGDLLDLEGLGVKGNCAWCRVIDVILFMGLRGAKRWGAGVRFNSHHMWGTSYKVGGNGYGGS